MQIISLGDCDYSQNPPISPGESPTLWALPPDIDKLLAIGLMMELLRLENAPKSGRTDFSFSNRGLRVSCRFHLETLMNEALLAILFFVVYGSGLAQTQKYPFQRVVWPSSDSKTVLLSVSQMRTILSALPEVKRRPS